MQGMKRAMLEVVISCTMCHAMLIHAACAMWLILQA